MSRSSHRGRLTLWALTLGSGIAILDGTVVNIAVPTIGRDLHASLAQLQWIVNGYLLSLAALVLVGGALGDRLGRRRIYVLGLALFAIASAACALAPSPTALVGCRVVQGIGGALATPGALAIIQSSFLPEDRAPAIGTWAGWSGIAAAAGPFIGGWLIEHAGWRWIFWINVPLCIVVVLVCLAVTPESSDADERGQRFDVVGAVLTAVGLGVLTYALTASGNASRGLVWGTGLLGVAIFAGFAAYERRVPNPLVPLGLFASRIFSAANAMTFLVYGSMGAFFLFLILQLQVTAGWTPIESGLATLPVTIAMMLLSSRAAAMSARIGPRIPMTVGPLLAAGGVLLLIPVGRESAYLTGVFPGVALFSLGLAALVSPLTTAVLAAAPDHLSGLASGINNAVARAGSLLAVAALPGLVGLSGADYADPAVLTHGYRLVMVICAVLLAAGGIVSWFGLGRRSL
ncbi:MAG: MFS transporter [Nostocoides sp.]